MVLSCIKPNKAKQAKEFDEKFVLAQLRYSGVLETARIRQQGYGVRRAFVEFVNRYRYDGVVAISARPEERPPFFAHLPSTLSIPSPVPITASSFH